MLFLVLNGLKSLKKNKSSYGKISIIIINHAFYKVLKQWLAYRKQSINVSFIIFKILVSNKSYFILTKFLCSRLRQVELFAQGRTANSKKWGQDSNLDNLTVGLTLNHCTFISQVWLWQKHNWGKGVFHHWDTVIKAQAKRVQWISHETRLKKPVCMWCWWDGGDVIYTHARETSCWSPSYSLNTQQNRGIMKYRTPVSPVRGCSIERLESGCNLPSQLPQSCPLHFVRIFSRMDLATVVLPHVHLGILLLTSFFHNYRAQYFGKMKHLNMKYNLVRKQPEKDILRNK